MTKLNFWIVLLSVLLSIFPFHYFINTHLSRFAIGEIDVSSIHIFLLSFTIFIVLAVALFEKYKSSHTGFFYIALMLLKMICSVIFLWGWIAKKTPESKIIIGHFFAAFLLYLLVEVLFILANLFLSDSQSVNKT